MNRSPVIVGLGAQTAVGLNLPANVAVVRAGLNCFRLSDYLLGYKEGEPLKVSQLDSLPKDAAPFERMKSMAVAAASEGICPWFQFFERDPSPGLAVFLSVPAARPGIQDLSGKGLIQAVIADLPIRPDKPHCMYTATGNEGGVAALVSAANLIRNGDLQAALVGGVECYHSIETLHCLEADRKSTRLNSSHGYISYAVFCLKKKKNKKI